MDYLKRIWPYLLAFMVFVAVACIYMSPVFDGKVIASTDGVQGRAAVHECVEYSQQTGNYSWWTGSMFSGMPNYQIGGGRYMANVYLRPLLKTLQWGHTNVLAIVLIYCLCFFALVRSMKVDKWLSIVGALAITFSSYFFIIIAANHHGKTSTLALMSLALSGFYLIFNGHRKTGICLSMIGTMAGFYPHPQMAYYLCFIFAAFGAAELFKAWKNKSWKSFAINCLLALAALGIGVGTGTSATFANLEYAEETMRGGHSDLVKSSDADNKTKGLDLDYATAWSYGIDECWTFLVPDYMGGSSNYNAGSDSELCKDMIKQGVPKKSAEQFCKNVPTYWGDQPFTAGPVYMGAIVCMLFLLGLFVVKGPYKWALLVVTLLSVMLSWGYHFMGLTRFFFDNVPMYNKFRAVSSILVIAEITMPLLGFLALQSLVEAKKVGEDLSKKVLTAGGIVVALALVCLMFTSGFEGRSDAQMPEWLTPMLIDARRAMLSADCWRSIIFVAFGTAVVWFYTKSQKFTTPLLAIALGVLVLADMWPVAKRFMNDSHFSQGNAYEKEFKMQPWEKQILDSDKDPNFRVFNLTASPFNDARTSYYLKSIGGYSAAKLRRYQDLIDQHLSKMHMPVINMLNTKYIIVPDQQTGAPVVQYNPDAMGNAWFVEKIVEAKTPNEECDNLMTLDLHREAVVGSDYINNVKDLNPGADSLAHISLTKYTPEYIEYDAECSKPGTVIFSEIFYSHGWKAIVDGKPADLYRANYMLRAMNLEPGKHHIRLEFRPESVDKGNVISMTFVVLMYLIIAGILLSNLRKSKAKD